MGAIQQRRRDGAWTVLRHQQKGRGLLSGASKTILGSESQTTSTAAADGTARACATSHFSCFLSETQSEVITESGHGKRGVGWKSCVTERQRETSPFGEWQEQRTTGSRTVTGGMKGPP